MTRLYITRHGQTEWNVLKKMQGNKDSDLTDLGRNQALWLGERLKNVNIDVIVSSSSGRAMKTSELIRGERDIELLSNDDLREINLGVWEGMPSEDILAQYPAEYNNFWENPHLFNSIGGENFRELIFRVSKAVDKIAIENTNKSILIVTHTAVIKALFTYFENKEIKDFWSGPYINATCLSIVDINGFGRHIVMQGDTSHYKI